jgi:hypothetical protein
VDRWFFGREPARVTHVFDTSGVIDRQMAAVRCHRTPIANMARHWALQADTAGLDPAEIARATADPAAALTARLRQTAATCGAPHGLTAAEALRLHAGGLGDSIG